MKFALIWMAKALKQLEELDHPVADRIAKKMEWYASQENPLSFAKKLVHPEAMLFRFRIGDYRAICHWKDRHVHILYVLTVGDRRDIYETL